MGLGVVVATPVATADCPITMEERTVRGNSLTPLLAHGQDVAIQMDYYACHPVERDDLVVFRHAGTQTLIKLVPGLPGETMALAPIEEGAAWRLLVNGEVVTNSEGEPYRLDARGERMLSLYIRDYRGVIPPGTYLVLGNLPNGSRDSTAFGLIGASQLLGKAEQPPALSAASR
jgi:signal peptidase I